MLMMRCLVRACDHVVLLRMDPRRVGRRCACDLRGRHRHAVVAEARRVRVGDATTTARIGKMLTARGEGGMRYGQRRRSHDERSLLLALFARFATYRFLGGKNGRSWM